MSLLDAIQFLTSVPDSSLLYASSYHPVLVVISVLIAILGSFSALSMTPRIMRATSTWEKSAWIIVGAFAMGSGVWAMHFIGMLALHLPCNIYFEPITTFVSMLPSVLASGVALSIISSQNVGKWSVMAGSVLMGAGIGVMHYSGMAAMRLQGFVRYDPKLFVLSILVAVVLAYVALHVRGKFKAYGRDRDVLAAAIMGGAISGMHYTAMSAAYFVRGNEAVIPYAGFNATYLAMAAIFATLLLTVMAIIGSIEHRNLEKREEDWRFALEGAGYGIWEWNVQTGEAQLSRKWKEMLGLPAENSQTTFDEWSKFVYPEDLPVVMADIQSYFDGKSLILTNEHRLLCKDGSQKWVLAHGSMVSRDAKGKPLRLIGTFSDITERKQAELERELRNTLLITQMDTSPDAILFVDENAKIVSYNQQFMTLWGVSKDMLKDGSDELVLQRGLALIADPDSFLARVKHLYQHREELSQEEIELKDGRVLDRYTAPVIGTSGKYFGRVWHFRDITERKQAQEVLRRQEDQIHLILDSTAEAIYGIDMEGKCTFCNNSCLSLLGYTEVTQLLGKNMHWQIHHKHADGTPFPVEECRIFQAFQRGQHTHVDDEVLWRADGSSFPAEYWSYPQYRGDAIVGAAVTFIDISERRRLESEVAEGQQKYETLFATASDTIFIMDGEKIIDCNAAALSMFRCTREQIIGKSPADISPPIQPDGTSSAIAVKKIISKLSSDGQILYFEWLNQRADGEPFFVEVGLSTLRSHDGNYLVAFVRDISERKQTEERERTRNHILEQLAKGAPLSEVLQSVVSSVELQHEDMRCSILLMDDEGKRLLIGAAPSMPDFYAAAIHGIEIGKGMGSCGTAAFTGERVIVEDIQTHPDCAPYKELAANASLGSCWSEPIKDVVGKVLGTFAIYRSRTGAPSASDIQLIEQVANLLGIAIAQSRANEARQLALLVYQNSSEAMMVIDADGLIVTTNPAFTELTGYTLEEVIGKNPNILSSGRQDQEFYQAMWHSINTTGSWQGEIWNRRKSGEVYAEWLSVNSTYNKDGSVHSRVGLFSDITKRKESEELIWQQANFDVLTGLPNRHMFHNRLDQEIKKSHRANMPLALLFLDLDRFKEVNDTLGHNMGDILLKEAAQRLSSCVRETDTVARLGGDEFTIILSALSDPGSVERAAEDMLQKLAAPFHLGQETAYISVSIGITMYPDDAISIEALLKNADQAMYTSKSQGRNRYSYFTPAMQEAAQYRMRLANDLRSALDNKQFYLVYQPILELPTGDIHKAEALIRWQHPTRGLINPAEFIPIAEETGLIVQIGDWVFHEAASQVKRLRASYDPMFQISINKSPTQFHNEVTSHASWIRHLKKLGLAGNSIVVEITEGLLLDSSPIVAKQLLEFRNAGMEVSLDDFGTGYSALSYLKKFHIDYLKIDQSFVRNLIADSSDLALCEAIIVMAHKLGIKVIAEGVETTEQCDLLTSIRCDYGQGYLFFRPISVEWLELLLGEPSESLSAIK